MMGRVMLTDILQRPAPPSRGALLAASAAPPPVRPRGRGAALTIEEWESLPPALRRAAGSAHLRHYGEGWG